MCDKFEFFSSSDREFDDFSYFLASSSHFFSFWVSSKTTRKHPKLVELTSHVGMRDGILRIRNEAKRRKSFNVVEGERRRNIKFYIFNFNLQILFGTQHSTRWTWNNLCECCYKIVYTTLMVHKSKLKWDFTERLVQNSILCCWLCCCRYFVTFMALKDYKIN